jgi:hypothetical protein
MPRKRYIDDVIEMPFENTPVSELLDKAKLLEGQGWKNIVVIEGYPDNGRGHFYNGRPHCITGKRIETTKERNKRIKDAEKAKLKRKKDAQKKREKEINLMKRLAKKYNYTIMETH